MTTFITGQIPAQNHSQDSRKNPKSSNFILHPTALDFQLAWVTFHHGKRKQLNSYLMTFYLSFYPRTPRWRSISRNARSPWQPLVIKLITYEDSLPCFEWRLYRVQDFCWSLGEPYFPPRPKQKQEAEFGMKTRFMNVVRFLMKAGLQTWHSLNF